MADFLTRLAQRAIGAPASIEPRRPSLFEPASSLAVPGFATAAEPGTEMADETAAARPLHAVSSPLTPRAPGAAERAPGRAAAEPAARIDVRDKVASPAPASAVPTAAAGAPPPAAPIDRAVARRTVTTPTLISTGNQDRGPDPDRREGGSPPDRHASPPSRDQPRYAVMRDDMGTSPVRRAAAGDTASPWPEPGPAPELAAPPTLAPPPPLLPAAPGDSLGGSPGDSPGVRETGSARSDGITARGGETPPPVRVSIGRVEVRVTPPPAASAPVPTPARASRLQSLEDYLRHGSGGKR